MDPITIVGITLATIIVSQTILKKVYTLFKKPAQTVELEFVSSQVSNTM
jgi:hypothetical protein